MNWIEKQPTPGGSATRLTRCSRKQATFTHAPVVGLLIPNDFAAIITEIVLESVAASGYRPAHSTDPSLFSAKSSPRLILSALGFVGAHNVRKYSSECSANLPISFR